MGNLPVSPFETVLEPEEKDIFTRYIVTVINRYETKSSAKVFVYVSAKEGIEIHPSDPINPIRPYNESHWKQITNDWHMVSVKKSLVDLCKRYLEGREIVMNEIQKQLDVN